MGKEKRLETTERYSLRSSLNLRSRMVVHLARDSLKLLEPRRASRSQKKTQSGKSDKKSTTINNGELLATEAKEREEERQKANSGSSQDFTTMLSAAEGSKSSPTKKRKNTTVEPNASHDYPLEVVRSLCLKLSTDEFIEIESWKNEKQCIETTLRNTVEKGDSGSLLVCGAAGVGKSSLVNYCLKGLNASSIPFTKLNLNGLVVPSDKSAFIHVSQKLDLSFVDLPSFISEFESRLRAGLKLIIILDMFHLFCRRHQTFLYNLFDVAQRAGNLCIIGLTRRLDCVELLEKRVKSRMNQRIVNLTTPFSSSDEYFKFATRLLNDKLQLSDVLKEKLRIQYSINRSILALKKCLVENLMADPQEKMHLCDSRTRILCSLSLMQFCIVLLAYKYVSNMGNQTFNCFSLQPSLAEIPTQINISHKLFLKAVDSLVQCGLLQICTSSDSSLYLTEWTPLSLTIDEVHIKHALAINERSLPSNICQLVASLR